MLLLSMWNQTHGADAQFLLWLMFGAGFCMLTKHLKPLVWLGDSASNS